MIDEDVTLENSDDAEFEAGLRLGAAPARKQIVGDRSFGRISIRPALGEGRVPTSMVSAWEVGRMLSRLNWDVQLSMLGQIGHIQILSEDRIVSSLDALFVKLAHMARGLAETTLAKDRVERNLRQVWDEFNRLLIEAAEIGCPLSTDWLDANHVLIRQGCSRCQDAWDLQPLHDELCLGLVSPCIDLIASLLQALEGHIGELELRALHLGKHLDHGLRPKDAYRLTFAPPEDFEAPQYDPSKPRQGSWWLATRVPTPGEVVPDWEWFSGIEQRWRELGLDDPLPQELLDSARGRNYRGSSNDLIGLGAFLDRSATESLLRLGQTQAHLLTESLSEPGQVERHPVSQADSTPELPESLSGSGPVSQADTIPVSPVSPVLPGPIESPESPEPPESIESPESMSEPGPVERHLGLLFYEGFTIGRRDCKRTIKLSSKPVLWFIMVKICNYSGGYCSKANLRSCWKEAGREPDPVDNTIRQSICRLRKLLKRERLGVLIDGSKRIGWRILDTRDGLSEAANQ